MKNTSILLALSAISLISPVAFAQDNEGDSVKSEQANYSSETSALNEQAIPMVSAGETIDELIQQFADEQGFSYGTVDKERYFLYGTGTVKANPNHPDYGKWRVQAFERAVLDAQSKYLRDRFGEQIVEVSRKIFNDDSTNASSFEEEEFTRTKYEAIIAKLSALTDEKLNLALEELGVDPTEYNSIPASRKKQLFMDNLTNKSLLKAYGDTSGIIPIQTFEANSGYGSVVVGVIMMHTQKTRQIADDIKNNRVPSLTGRPRVSIDEIIPKDSAILKDQFGPRLVYNENGEPCLISYGQWSHSFTGSDSFTRERKLSSAKNQARILADSYITSFSNSKMNYEEDSEVSDVIESFASDNQGEYISIESAEEIIDKVNTVITRRSKASTKGRTTIKTWTYKPESGPEIVGVVRLWTPNNLEQIKRMDNWKPQKNGQPKGSSPSAPASTPSVSKGIPSDTHDW